MPCTEVSCTAVLSVSASGAVCQEAPLFGAHSPPVLNLSPGLNPVTMDAHQRMSPTYDVINDGESCGHTERALCTAAVLLVRRAGRPLLLAGWPCGGRRGRWRRLGGSAGTQPGRHRSWLCSERRVPMPSALAALWPGVAVAWGRADSRHSRLHGGKT